MIGKMMTGEKKESQFMSPQEINLEKQKQILREREKQLRQQLAQNKANKQTHQPMPKPMNQQTHQPMPKPINQPMNQPMNQSFDQQQLNQDYTIQPPSIPQFRSNTRDIPEIRAPENVQEILNRIRNQNLANNTDSMDDGSSNNERLLSDVNLSDSKKGKGKKVPMTKPSISVNI